MLKVVKTLLRLENELERVQNHLCPEAALMVDCANTLLYKARYTHIQLVKRTPSKPAESPQNSSKPVGVDASQHTPAICPCSRSEEYAAACDRRLDIGCEGCEHSRKQAGGA